MGPHLAAGAGQAMEVRINPFSVSLMHFNDGAGRILPFSYALRHQWHES